MLWSFLAGVLTETEEKMKAFGLALLALALASAVASAQQSPTRAGATAQLPVLVSVTCSQDALERIQNEREHGQSAMDAKLALLLQSGDCNVN